MLFWKRKLKINKIMDEKSFYKNIIGYLIAWSYSVSLRSWVTPYKIKTEANYTLSRALT